MHAMRMTRRRGRGNKWEKVRDAEEVLFAELEDPVERGAEDLELGTGWDVGMEDEVELAREVEETTRVEEVIVDEVD
jgi:hypothetical protein